MTPRPTNSKRHKATQIGKLTLLFIVAFGTISLILTSQKYVFPFSSSCTTNTFATTTPGVEEIKRNNHHQDYQLAYDQSFGFFDDIPSYEWKRIQKNVKKMGSNMCESCPGGKAPGAWFQNHFEPEISCRHEQRIGKLGDGGKWICDPHRIADPDEPQQQQQSGTTRKPDRPCLVYSVGSNNDFSFEMEVFAKIGKRCEIHTFDPGNFGNTAKRLRESHASNGSTMNLAYHRWGIDGESKRQGNTELLTLNETIHRLGHVGRTIDIFKIDCEFCELSSFSSWIGLDSNGDRKKKHIIRLQQVLVEVHANIRVLTPDTENFFRGMKEQGYVIFHKEPNIHYWGPVHAAEFGFLKLAPSFFK